MTPNPSKSTQAKLPGRLAAQACCPGFLLERRSGDWLWGRFTGKKQIFPRPDPHGAVILEFKRRGPVRNDP